MRPEELMYYTISFFLMYLMIASTFLLYQTSKLLSVLTRIAVQIESIPTQVAVASNSMQIALLSIIARLLGGGKEVLK